MKNYVILFASALAACVYALFALEPEDCPGTVLVMAKIGAVVSILGLLYSGFYLSSGNKMSLEK